MHGNSKSQQRTLEVNFFQCLKGKIKGKNYDNNDNHNDMVT